MSSRRSRLSASADAADVRGRVVKLARHARWTAGTSSGTPTEGCQSMPASDGSTAVHVSPLLQFSNLFRIRNTAASVFRIDENAFFRAKRFSNGFYTINTV